MKTALNSAAAALLGFAATANAAHIWINEFHYDNTGSDTGEFVEIALSSPNMSGFGPSDYAIELFNGNGGSLYDTSDTLDNADFISGPISVLNSTNTITLYALNFTAIQNGSPDGIALVNKTNNTVESFFSYEGSFTAVGGIAGGLGLTSTDVGVEEGGGTAVGTSISALGIGMGANDFDATSFATGVPATPGAINDGQIFAAPRMPPANNVPDGGSTLSILGLALLGLGAVRGQLVGRA